MCGSDNRRFCAFISRFYIESSRELHTGNVFYLMCLGPFSEVTVSDVMGLRDTVQIDEVHPG